MGRSFFRRGIYFCVLSVWLFCGFCIVGLCRGGDIQADYYVSPEGSDANAGTIGSPLRTMTGARDLVRRVNANMSGDIVVHFHGGMYPVTETIVFDHRDSASNGHQIVYTAQSGARVIFSGGQAISNWSKGENGIWQAPAGKRLFRQLYVNGRRGVRSRTPNSGTYYRVKDWDTETREILVPAGQIQRWDCLDQVEINVQMAWAEAIMRLKDFKVDGDVARICVQDPERRQIFLREYPKKRSECSYHFENAYAFIDQGGEWYHNRETGILYYKPRANETIEQIDAVIPVTETLVRIEGTADQPVCNVQFVGLEFRHSGWVRPSVAGNLDVQAGQYTFRDDNGPLQYTARPPAAIEVNYAKHLRFERNVIAQAGATGVDFDMGVWDSEIEGNVFYDISGNGVSVARFSDPETGHGVVFNPDDARDVCRHVRIANNIIRRAALDYPGCVGIACGYPQQILIEHNEVSDLPYTGISIGWGWTTAPSAMKENVIQFNHIHHVMGLLCDGGGIYTLSHQPGSRIFENHIHHIGHSQWAHGADNNGIFFDQGSDGITIEHNCIHHTADARVRMNRTGELIFLNSGKCDKSVRDNAGLELSYLDIRKRVR